MAGYADRLREYREAAEEAGHTWACGDCGATDKALSFWPVDGPTIASRALYAPDWTWFYRQLETKPLLCVNCRMKRDRALEREAIRRAVLSEKGGE